LIDNGQQQLQHMSLALIALMSVSLSLFGKKHFIYETPTRKLPLNSGWSLFFDKL
jgi:hypothetical protein